MMNNLLKKLLLIMPILIVGVLFAAFLPNILTFASLDNTRRNTQELTKPLISESVGSQKDDADGRTSATPVGAPIEKNIISEEKARQIAGNKVSGTITEIELDDDRYYELEIMVDGNKNEMKIDAVTGEILKLQKNDQKTKPNLTKADDKGINKSTDDDQKNSKDKHDNDDDHDNDDENDGHDDDDDDDREDD